MEDINTYLNEDASEEDRQAAQRLQEGFAALRLEEKVKTAAAQRRSMQWKNRLRQIFGFILFLVFLSGIAWWWTRQSAEGEVVPPEEPELLQEQEVAPPSSEKEVIPPPTTEEKEREDKMEEPESPALPPNLPIAQADPEPSLPPPAFEAPATYLRGQSQQQEGKELLDQLWYTGYPLQGLVPDERFAQVDELLRERTFTTAYVRLQRLDRQLEPSDTLRYLQAYTLLEMGQGQEVLLLLDQIEAPPSTWGTQLEWYRALAHLLADEQEAALVIFRELAKQADHPYHLHAKKALELYQ